MGILGGTTAIIKAAQRAITGRVVSLMLPNWMSGIPTWYDANYENSVKQGLRKNEIVYACITATADTGALISAKAHTEGTDEEIPNHPFRYLITHPNPHMSESQFFWFTIVNLKIVGRAYWQKVRDRKTGEVVGLWPIRPDWITPVHSETQFIDHYEFRPQGNAETLSLPPEDVIEFIMRDPADMWKGLSPLTTANRVIEVDNGATDFIKLFWEQGASPSGVLTTKQNLSDDAITDIQRRWTQRYGGWRSWSAPAVLSNEASYARMGLTFQEMDFSNLDKRNEVRICSVMRVPPIIIGITAGLDTATYSNYEQARKAWWQDVLTPLYKMIADTLNAQLVPEFGLGYYAKFDFSDVPAMQEDRSEKWTRANSAYRAGLISRGMALQEMGLQMLADEAMNEEFYQQQPQIVMTPDGQQMQGKPKPPKRSRQVDTEENVKRRGGIRSYKSEPVKPEGEPLTGDAATEVDNFHNSEIDKLFKLYSRIKGEINNAS